MQKQEQQKTQAMLTLDRNTSTPLYQQLYEYLKQAILSGQLARGRQLPSTRSFAAELGVARTTVQVAFEQLIAEGYIEGYSGSGTYVAANLPEGGFSPYKNRTRRQEVSTQQVLSQQAQDVLAYPYFDPPLRLSGGTWARAFRVGQPAYDAFPAKLWERNLMQGWRKMEQEKLTYQQVAGYPPLREEIAAYLATSRGVQCTAKQVIIVNGSQQGIDLVARVLLNPHEQVWMEDPGYLGATGAFAFAGVSPVPIPVDREGLSVEEGKARAPDARLAFVTPSHQFPLGVIMSLRRRIQLLEWASTEQAWILEDDYDSEFRYIGRPLAALQGLDRVNRVLYLGTFSKVLFPALRLGYLVVPSGLVQAFVHAQLFALVHPPLLEQIALATFLHEGHFLRHIHRMRHLYQKRQRLLLEMAQSHLGTRLILQQDAAGMHVLGWLPHEWNDLLVAQRAAQALVDVSPLSLFCQQKSQPPALLLGYTAVQEAEMQAGLQKLATILQ